MIHLALDKNKQKASNNFKHKKCDDSDPWPWCGDKHLGFTLSSILPNYPHLLARVFSECLYHQTSKPSYDPTS